MEVSLISSPVSGQVLSGHPLGEIPSVLSPHTPGIGLVLVE